MSTTLTPPAAVVEIAVQMSKSAFWNNVRQTRAQMAKFFQKNWDPNYPIPSTERWIYITAVEDGEVNIMGTERKATRTFESSVENAAQAIASHTHRLSSEEEIRAFRIDRTNREEKCRNEEERVNPSVAAQRASVRSTEVITKVVQELVADRNEREAQTTEAGKGKGK